MTETRMVIRESHPPTRCEICHQSDLFDGEAGICLRCKGFVWYEGQPQHPRPAPARTTSPPRPATPPPPVQTRQSWWHQVKKPMATVAGMALVGLGAFFYYSEAHSTPAANTLQAIHYLENLHRAEMSFSHGPGKGNFTANLLQLGANPHGNCLCGECVARLQRTSSGSQETNFGYILGPVEVTPATETTPAGYAAFIYPVNGSGDLTGNDAFYIDQTGVVRHSGMPYIIPNENSDPVR
ncbi:MAG: hypothetical protein K1Y36_11725 [Blastocatellia bacterium]|nr:hypothetical protein [Blastocatellia bacterium]